MASPTISCRRCTWRRRAPVVLAPAMNTNMFAHPAVVANLETLTRRGVRIVEPGAGYLACGWIGKGRLAEPEDVVAFVQQLLTPAATPFSGRAVLVTAGPTYENIDPGPLHRQSGQRPDGIRRWPPRRCAAGRG